MIVEYSKVKIRHNGVIGEVVDIYKSENEEHYTVESNTENTTPGENRFPLFDCTINDLEEI